MSDTQAPLDSNDPILVAWQAYKQTPEYERVRRYAAMSENLTGSLWAMFLAGWMACQMRQQAPGAAVCERGSP